MLRVLNPLLIVVLFLGSVGAAAQAEMYKGYETPNYAVLQQSGDVELRRYTPYKVAEVTVRGTQDSAVGTGFRMLAGYIFGGNAEGSKVAMTTPVTQRGGEAETWTVQFMMPKGYDNARLPTPENPAIRLREVDAETHIALTFSGLWGSTALQEREQSLRAYADANGLRLSGAPIYKFYDGPFTLPWNRRNEIAFVVR